MGCLCRSIRLLQSVAKVQCRSWLVWNGHVHRCCGADGHPPSPGHQDHWVHCEEPSCVQFSREVATAAIDRDSPGLDPSTRAILVAQLPRVAELGWNGSEVPIDLLRVRGPRAPHAEA